MRRIISVILYLGLFLNSNAQSGALSKGQPSISLPICDFSVDNVEVEVTLHYSSSGIKPKTRASNVGMGWNLIYGGSITRELRDIPDEAFVETIYETSAAGGATYSYPSGQICGWLLGPKLDNGNGSYTYLDPSYEVIETVSDETNSNMLSDFIKLLDFENDDIRPDPSLVTELSEWVYYDNEPDVFHFSFLGRSGSFVFEPNGNYPSNNGVNRINQIPFQDLLIDYEFTLNSDNHGFEITRFIITDEKGNKYYFEEKEYTSSASMETVFAREKMITYTSGWYLSRVETPYHHTISFNYKSESEIIHQGFATYPYSITIPTTHVAFLFGLDANGVLDGTLTDCIKKPILDDISSEDFRVDFIYDVNNREDSYYKDNGSTKVYNENRLLLEKIRLIKSVDGNEKVLKSINFKTDYITTDVLTENLDNKKLCLLELYEDFNDVKQPGYAFNYKMYNENTIIPIDATNHYDYWGYYNGTGNDAGDDEPTLYMETNTEKNIYLYPPEGTEGTDYIKVTGYSSYTGNNMLPSANNMDYGILTSIENVFGGITNYYWEPNTFNYNGSIEIGSGLRMRKVEYISEMNTLIKEYGYHSENDESTTSGSLNSIPKYHHFDFSQTRNDGVPYTIVPSNLNVNNQGVTYSQVTEYIGGVDDVIVNSSHPGKNGKYIYYYNNAGTVDAEDDGFGIYEDVTSKYLAVSTVPNSGENNLADVNLPSGYKMNYGWASGQTEKIEEYDYNNMIQSRKTYVYDMLNQATFKTTYGLNIKPFSAIAGVDLFYYKKHPFVTGLSKKMISTIDQKYYNNSSKILETETNYEYDNIGRLITKTVNYQDSKQYQQKWFFSDSFLYPASTASFAVATKYLDEHHINDYCIEEVALVDNKVISGVLNIPQLINESDPGKSFVAREKLYKLTLSEPVPEASFVYAYPAAIMIYKSSDYIQTQNNFVFNDDAVIIQKENSISGIKQFTVANNHKNAIAKGSNADISEVLFEDFEAGAYVAACEVEGVAHTGSYSTKARLVDWSNTTTINLEPNKQYVVRFWAKKGNAGGDYARVAIANNPSSSTTIVPTDDDNWVMAENTFTTESDGTQTVYILTGGGTGTDLNKYHYIDNIQIFPVGTQFSVNTFNPYTLDIIARIDARGNVVYSDYDNSNRLVAQRDYKGNITLERRYNNAKMAIKASVKNVEFNKVGGNRNIEVLTPRIWKITVPEDAFYTVEQTGQSSLNISCYSNFSNANRSSIFYIENENDIESRIAIEVNQLNIE